DEHPGGDLVAAFSSAVKDEAEADRELARWKGLLPPAPSAYRPSGRLPLSGLVLSILGALLGTVAGALATELLLWMTVLAPLLLAYCLVALAVCGLLAWGLALLCIGLALVALA